MKFQKVDTDILFEAFNALDNGVCIKGRNGRQLLVSYIGAVEIVVGKDEDGYVSDLYDAIQLPTGEILGINENNEVFSLSNQMFQIHWGCYPINFPETLKTTRKPPKAFAPWDPVTTNPEGIIAIDELPF